MLGGPVVIGLGNRLRGDDAIGLEVARDLASLRPDLRVVEHDREPLDLIELWTGAGSALLIDAVAGEEPGRIHRFEASSGGGPWRRGAPASSHAFDVGQVIELASTLGRAPERLEVIGIEGWRFDPGTAPSTAVRDAARALVEELASRSLGP